VEVGEALERVIAALPGGGERRDGQLEMATAIAEAIADDRHVIVQAGTGTGKSLGYLVPALLSGRKVVVATATKALQDQLATKDLPFLAQHLGRPVRFAVLKGRSNYFCRQAAAEAIQGPEEQLTIEPSPGDAQPEKDTGSRLGREVLKLVEWGRTATSGDRALLDFEPSPRAWSAVSVSAMECPGVLKCPSGDNCFAEAARLEAEAADVVVVNSHLYGADVNSGGRVLPQHDVVIFDEAHELEDIASSSLGLELTAGRFRAMGYSVRRLGDADAGEKVLDLADRFEAAFDPARGQRLLPGRADITRFLDTAGEHVREATGALRKASKDDPSRERALQAAGHLAGDITFVREASDQHVVWVEGMAGSPVVKVAPLDVGSILLDRLWTADPDSEGAVAKTAVFTSATIPGGLGPRLGLPLDSWDELDVGSPFDFADHALLYCAAHLPDPRSPDYEAAMHSELDALLRAAGGRTLALFTSWRAMNAAAAALADTLPFDVYKQSDFPKPALLKRFTEDETSCLFATMGFWQGVDVPGPALSQVIIDRIPFPRPDEPLLQARRDRAGPSAFRMIDLPRAATLLAQGAGRLIRSHTDRGVVSILDPRLAKANYKWDLVNALPPMRRTRQREDVESFLRDLATP
jgi:ATP-dependent DNA helicase DinG